MSPKKKNKLKYIINEPEEIKEPRFANTVRIGMTDGSFELSFGRGTPINNEQIQIDVVSKIIMPDSRVVDFILNLFQAIEEYEKEYGKEIIPRKPESENDG